MGSYGVTTLDWKVHNDSWLKRFSVSSLALGIAPSKRGCFFYTTNWVYLIGVIWMDPTRIVIEPTLIAKSNPASREYGLQPHHPRIWGTLPNLANCECLGFSRMSLLWSYFQVMSHKVRGPNAAWRQKVRRPNWASRDRVARGAWRARSNQIIFLILPRRITATVPQINELLGGRALRYARASWGSSALVWTSRILTNRDGTFWIGHWNTHCQSYPIWGMLFIYCRGGIFWAN